MWGGGAIAHRSNSGHVIIMEVAASYRSLQVIFGDSRSSILQYLIKTCKAELESTMEISPKYSYLAIAIMTFEEKTLPSCILSTTTPENFSYLSIFSGLGGITVR